MVVQAREWDQVGKRFTVLGEHLRSHFDDVGADAASEREALERSVRGLMSALEDTISSTGRAVRDPMLRQELAELAASVRSAFLTTLENAGEQVRDRLPEAVRSRTPLVGGTRHPAAPAQPHAAVHHAPKPGAPKAGAPKAGAPRATARKPAATRRTRSHTGAAD